MGSNPDYLLKSFLIKESLSNIIHTFLCKARVRFDLCVCWVPTIIRHNYFQYLLNLSILDNFFVNFHENWKSTKKISLCTFIELYKY